MSIFMLIKQLPILHGYHSLEGKSHIQSYYWSVLLFPAPFLLRYHVKGFHLFILALFAGIFHNQFEKISANGRIIKDTFSF